MIRRIHSTSQSARDDASVASLSAESDDSHESGSAGDVASKEPPPEEQSRLKGDADDSSDAEGAHAPGYEGYTKPHAKEPVDRPVEHLD